MAIESRGLGKRFGQHWAVAGLGLHVEEGTIYGFLGANGAGKTTTIRLILGLLRPTCGEVRVFGCDVATERMRAARFTGALLEARATYDHLSGRENLDTTRRLLGLPLTEIDRVLEAVAMRDAADRKVGHYSLGMRQRIGLARAMLGNPRLLILDEPMNGLDPDGMRDMRDIIRALPARTGATVFLSSHLLSEVQQTVTHIGLMHDGRLVLQGGIGEMLRRVTPEAFIRTSDDAMAMQVLSAHCYSPLREGFRLRVPVQNGDASAAKINRELLDAGIEVAELSVRQTTLETLYMQVREAQSEPA